jgi:hypothetical protein
MWRTRITSLGKLYPLGSCLNRPDDVAAAAVFGGKFVA